MLDKANMGVFKIVIFRLFIELKICVCMCMYILIVGFE